MKNIEFGEHMENCRMIAKHMVADVKRHPNRSVRTIVDVYWEKLPRLSATMVYHTLEFFRETDMGSMPTFYAEVLIRDCIIRSNEHNVFNPSEEVAEERKHEIRAFADFLEETEHFRGRIEDPNYLYRHTEEEE